MESPYLSLDIFIALIVICIIGIFILYKIMKNNSISDEHIDKIISIGKWFVVTVAITMSASVINDGFRDRELKMKELTLFDKYAKDILSYSGPNFWEDRLHYTEYFSAVAPEGMIRKSWENYHKIVKNHIDEANTMKSRLNILEIKMIQGKLSSLEKNELKSLSLDYDILNFNPTNNKTTPSTNTSGALVYIQVSNEKQKEKIGEVASDLRSQGFSVPGIENITGKATPPKTTSVRYFYDEDQWIAEKVKNKLHNTGFSDATIFRIRGMKTPVGTIEVWLSADD